MGFFKTLSVVAAVAATTFAGVIPTEHNMLAKRDACSSGPWAGPLEIGGNSGSPWCETRVGGSNDIITAVQAWTDGTRIRGVQFTYSNGDVSPMHGSIDKTTQTLTMVPGERIVNAYLMGNGIGTELGYISLTTDKGQSLGIGNNDKSHQQYPLNVGGGVILGAFGNQGSDIDSMGLLFLKSRVMSVAIGNMKFDSDPTGTSTNMQAASLAVSHYQVAKGVSGNDTWLFSGSQLETQTSTYEQSTTGTFGASMTVELSAEVLGIGAKTTAGYSWSVSHETSSTTTNTETKTLQWSQGGSLKAGTGVKCTAYAEKGSGSFPYTSTVTLNLEDKSTWTYDEPGVLTNVVFTDAYIQVEEEDNYTGPTGPVTPA